MAFSAKKYDLTSRWSFLEAWSKIAKQLDSGNSELFIPVPEGVDPFTFQMTFNRVRAAHRAQKEGGDIWDHIEVKHGKVKGQKVLRFTDRADAFPDLSIKTIDDFA